MQLIAVGAIASLLSAGIAMADNVLNDVVVGGNDTIASGGSTTITYRLIGNNAPNGDIGGCNVDASHKATLTIMAPAGVTATPSSVQFEACGVAGAKQVTFSSSSVGSHSIVHSVSGGLSGALYQNNADFTLKVTGSTDTTAPTVDCTVPDEAVWYADNVSVPCTASDPSGLQNPADASFSLTTDVAAEDENDSAFTDSKQVCDTLNNCATAGPYTFMVDRKGPSVQCDASPTFTLNQSGAQVSASVADGGSGPAASPVSANADTSAVGTGSSNVTGSDNAGNSTTVPCSFNVHYGFVGFTSPVDNPNVVNKAKAGQAIPLKWRLVDANNTPVTNLTSVNVTVKDSNCSLGTSGDAVEQYATGSSGLQNLGEGYYQFNWKTPTGYAKSCKSMTLQLGDGNTSHTALFEFTK
jgi:hypothetical protein